jgi:tight adherence protein B
MNPTFLIVIFLVLFAIVLVTIGVGYRIIESQRKKQVEGLLNVASGTQADEGTATVLLDQIYENPIDVLAKRIALTKRIGQMIQQAGLQWTPSRFLLATVFAAVVGGVIGFTFQPLGLIFSILLPAALLGMMPYWYLAFKRNRRLAEIEQQLPEALDFLARSMKAGHAFSISLEMLGAESPDPLGKEFRVLFNEQNLGAPMEVALANLLDRVPLLDVRMFVSSVNLQKQTGGNLSEILIRLAHVIRERFRLRGQVKAASAHGRLTALVLVILPIFLMFALLVVAPGYLQGMAKDPDGKYMIIGAIVAQIVGYFVMRRIVDIKV